ncbi:kisspeptin 2 [Hippoglossus hippoglossus]|uniref:kisspeptin 2 n=1 Tax=Hippoglossus hippoglossus TaxID=8267 RepID=UPI00148D869E|nr:kisspeptin 2 [Hippoglossus hippoglossus]XP_035003508.2 kisspeptin 2 [Hippoglossus stenolepis]
MRLVALAVVCGLIIGQDAGSEGAALPGYDSAQRTQATGSVLSALKRRTEADLVDEPSLCFSLRENEEQRQLLCNDRRSKFNFNPLSLRFGKRYMYRRAVKRARTNKFLPRSLFPRELEVPT